MFSKSQLNLLLSAQYGDDWTTEYFATQRLICMAPDSNISGVEFDSLMAWISTLTADQIYTLQIALTGLLDLTEYHGGI